MKLMLVVLALVPLAWAHQQRGLLDNFLNIPLLKNTLQDVLDVVGLDATEQACEQECHVLIQGEASLLETLCTPMCRSFQALIHTFNLRPDTTAMPAKRGFLDVGGLLDIAGVRNVVQDLLDVLGLDATEQQCETGCHSLVLGGETALLHTFCTPICRSFQTLVHTFNLRPETTVAGPVKRLFLQDFHLIDNNLLLNTLQDLVDNLGTDASEQQCEAQCHNLLLADPAGLVHTLCNPICRSFQELVHHYNIRPDTTAMAPAKRAFLGDLLDINLVRNTVQDLADILGLDATEQQCEAGCHGLILGEETSLLHTFCTPICRSFQSLVHTFNIRPDTTVVAMTTAMAPAKRGIFDGILNIDLVKNTVQDLLDIVGLDATEQACESGCHGLILGEETGLLHTFCTPICRSLQTLAHTFNLRPQTTVAPPAN